VAGATSKAFKIAFKLDAMLASGFGKTFDEAENRLAGVGDKLSSTGNSLTKGVTMPLLGVGIAALAVGADYDNSLGKIQARTEMTAAEIADLGDNFRDMAVSGEYGVFSARQIAEAYSQIAVRGQDAAFGTEIMRTSMVLATAVGDDLGNTAYFLGNYLLKVGKDVSYAEKYINLFAATNQRTGIGLNTLQDYLFRANASLNAAGISGTEATAVFGQLYQAGVRGANAYSGFQQAIETMLLPTDEQNSAFQRLGISTDSLEWQSKSTMEQFFALGDALEGVTDGTERLDLMSTLFTQGSARAFADELFNQRDALRDIIPELYEVSGAVDGTGTAFQMAAIQQEGMAGSIQQLKNSLEEIMLQISEALLPIAIRFVDFVGVWINRFASLDEGTRSIILGLGLAAAAAGPLLTITGKIVKGVGAAHAAYTTFKATLTSVKTATSLATAAQAAKTAATQANTLAAKADKAATAARKVATAAEAKALKLVAQAEAIKATAGAGSTKATIAATKATQARKAADALAVVASKKVATAEAARTVATKANTIALTADTAATKAKTLASTKLGKAYALLLAPKKATTAMLAAQTAGMKAATIAKGALTLGTKKLSAGFKLMGVAIKAIPVFGWILAGITAVIAGVTLLVRWLNRVGEEYKAVGEAADSLSERQAQLAESSATAAESFQQEVRVLEARAEQYKELANCVEHATKMFNLHRNELDRLSVEYTELGLGLEDTRTQISAIEEKLADGSNRRRSDTRALNDALDTLRATEIAYVEAMEANKQMQADVAAGVEVHADVLARLEQQQEEAAVAMATATAEMEEQMRKAEKWANAQTQALESMNASFENYKSLTTNVFQTVSENAAVSVSEMTSNLEANAAAIEEWSKNLAILADRAVDEGLIEQLRAAGPEAAASVRELVNASDQELDALNTAFGNSTQVAVESMKRELDPSGVASSALELIDSVATTILENDAMENALIDKAQASFEAMESAFADADFGSVASEIPEEFAQAIDENIDVVVTAASEIPNEAAQAIEENIDVVTTAASEIPNEAAQAIETNIDVVATAATEIPNEAARAIDTNIDVVVTAATEIPNSSAEAISAGVGAVTTAATEIPNAAAQAISAGIGAVTTAASEIPNAAAQAISAGSGAVVAASQQMMSEALAAMKAAAEISSPSRATFRIFGYVMDGGIDGMYSKYDTMMKAGEDIMDGLADTMYAKAGTVERVCKRISTIMAKGLYVKPQGFDSSGYEMTDGASNVVMFPSRSNPFSAQASFNRYNYLADDGAGYTPNPVNIMRQMGDSAYQPSGDMSVNYSPVYNIEGSSFNLEDLKAMLNQRDSEGEAKLRRLILQVMDDREYRKVRMSNA